MADELKKNMLNDDELNKVVGGVTYSQELFDAIFHSSSKLKDCLCTKEDSNEVILEKVNRTISDPLVRQWVTDDLSKNGRDYILSIVRFASSEVTHAYATELERKRCGIK